MLRTSLKDHLDAFLNVKDFGNDFCPNGLQIQGNETIKKIAFGVSASLEFIESAIEKGCDTLIVHHGVFWNYQDRVITGMIKERIDLIMKNDINLFAYHLPLDAHQTVGNNIALLNLICDYDVDTIQRHTIFTGPNGGIAIHTFPEHLDSMTIGNLISNINVSLNRTPTVVTPPKLTKEIDSIAVCTGSAGMFFETVIDQGVDAFITGEISEQHWHMSKESGVTYIAAGHTATETYGPLALMKYISETFKRELVEEPVFIPVHNPI